MKNKLAFFLFALLSTPSFAGTHIMQGDSVTVGTVTITNLTSGLCVQTGTGGLLTTAASACGTGAGGSSVLAITTGTVAGFSSLASSPTAVINFSSAVFSASLIGSATAFVNLNVSSVTLMGNTFNTTNNLVRLDTSGHLPALNASNLTALAAANVAAGTLGVGVVASSTNFKVSLATGVTGVLPAANIVSTVAFTTSSQTFSGSQIFTSTVGIVNSAGTPSFSISTSATGGLLVSVSSIPATNPSDYLLNISSTSGTTTFGFQNNSHVVSSGTTPSLGSCGTGSPTVSGTDMAGTITTGTGSPTTCVLNFASPYLNTPICLCGANGATACDPTSSSTTSITFTLGITETTINYICIGNKG